MEIRVENIADLDGAARDFLQAIGDRRHIAFHAEMGAGKTTFISALCKALGVEDEASSPTFSIVNEYHAAGRVGCDMHESGPAPGSDKIYHFDFYRIETPEETLDLGLDDYFDSGAMCLMEWPENVEDFLPEDTLDVYIEVDAEGVRVIRADE